MALSLDRNPTHGFRDRAEALAVVKRTRSMFVTRFCLLAFALSSASTRADFPYFEEIGREIPGMVHPGMGGFAAADFDGDGREDLAIAGTAGDTVIQIIGKTSNGIGIKQAIVLDNPFFVRALARSVENAPELYLLGMDDKLRQFSGWPLEQVRVTDLGLLSGLAAMAIGDIDNDGADDLVVVDGMDGNFIRVFDLATGAIRWTLPNDGGTSVFLRQLDADPALEIVVDGLEIRIIDGATQALEWSFQDGWYSCCLAAGRFLATGGEQVAVARGGGQDISVIRSNPFSIAWTSSRFAIGAMAAVDVDADGLDELVLGQTQWGGLEILNGAEGRLLYSFAKGGYGVSAVSGVNFSGSGRASIAYSPSTTYFEGDELFRMIDGLTGVTQWEMLNDRAGSYSTVALSDLNGDGRLELVFGSTGGDYTYGAISQMDAMTGVLQWQTPPHPQATSEFPYSLNIRGLELARRNGRSPLIIAAGDDYPRGRVTAVDSETHVVQWEVGSATAGPLLNRPVSQISMFDIDSDGNDEILVCTVDTGWGLNPVNVSVFSGENGALLWTSPGLDGGNVPSCADLQVGLVSDAGDPQIIAVLPSSLEAFNGLTHAHSWSLPVAAKGAALIEFGDSGRELAWFSGSVLRFHDAATRNYLRQLNVGAAISAVLALGSDSHQMLVAANGRLMIVDGVGGSVLATSEYMGVGLGDRNQLAAENLGGGSWLVGAGSEAGVFRILLRVSDEIFTGNFDAATGAAMSVIPAKSGGA
jgi:hypothetical protein